MLNTTEYGVKRFLTTAPTFVNTTMYPVQQATDDLDKILNTENSTAIYDVSIRVRRKYSSLT